MFFKNKKGKNDNDNVIVLLKKSLCLKKEVIIRLSYGIDDSELKSSIDEFLSEFEKNEYDIFFMNKHSTLIIESIRKYKNSNLKMKLRNFNLKHIDKNNYD